MEILENFSLNNIYRFCIYLSSVILVSSMLTEPIGINVNSLRSSCFKLIAIGLFAWVIDNYYYNNLLEQNQYYDDDDEHNKDSFIKYNNFKIGLNLVYLIIGLMIIWQL